MNKKKHELKKKIETLHGGGNQRLSEKSQLEKLYKASEFYKK